MRMKVDQFNSSPGDYTTYDLIQEFEISLYFSTVLLKYVTVIIGLFTVLVNKCEMFYALDVHCSQSICSAPMIEWLAVVWKNNPNQLRTFVENNVL